MSRTRRIKPKSDEKYPDNDSFKTHNHKKCRFCVGNKTHSNKRRVPIIDNEYR